MTIEEEYQLLLQSGLFWSWFPELTGDWERDKEAFTEAIKNGNKEE